MCQYIILYRFLSNWGTKYGVYYLGMSQHLEYGEVVLNGFTGYARPPYAFFGGKFVTVDTLYRVIPVCLFLYTIPTRDVGLAALARTHDHATKNQHN